MATNNIFNKSLDILTVTASISTPSITTSASSIAFNSKNISGVGSISSTGISVSQTTASAGTITQAGTSAVVGSGTAFSSAMIGGTLIAGFGGQPLTILTVTDATHLTVSASQTVTAGTTYIINYNGVQFDRFGNLSTQIIYNYGNLAFQGSNPVISSVNNNPVAITPNGSGIISLNAPVVTSTTLSVTGDINIINTHIITNATGLNSYKNLYTTGTIAQTGQAVTGTGTTWTSAMTNGLFVPATGIPCIVTQFIDATHITVSVSQTIASSTAFSLGYGGTQFDNQGTLGVQSLYLPTSGGTPSGLNYYQAATNVTISFTGAWSAATTFRFSRIGDRVRVMATASLNTASSAAVLNAAASSIPARYIPSEQLRIPFYVRDNLIDKAGLFTINTDGSIEISAGPAQDTLFTGLGSTGWFSQPLGWNL